MKTLILMCACLTTVLAYHKRYDGYQVLELTVTRGRQQLALDKLRDDPELDFWTDTPRFDLPIEVMVPPQRVDGVIDTVTQAGISYKVIRQNVQEGLDADWDRLKDKRDYDPNDYNTLEDIYAELYEMAARCPADITCEVYALPGESYEGREILVLKISKDEPDRMAFWFDSCIHAREWLAAATSLRVFDLLTRDYGSDTDVTELIDKYDFYLAPVINPDGYVFSWTDDRMWRKSRNVNAGSPCMGVDLNRNYDYYWGNAGTSDNPCSDTFRGPDPASEPETQLIQDEANRLSATVMAWTSSHTQAEMWLHPWGWEDDNNQCARSDDYDDLYNVAEAAAEAIMATHGNTWTYGTICETIYAAAGTTCDYVKGGAGVKYTFTPELRGPGFDPPPSAIQPSLEEFWNGVLAMVAQIEAQA